MSDSGDDDYFSSDIPLEPDGIRAHPLSQSFGKVSAPTLALYSEIDEFGRLPDIEATLKRWEESGGKKVEVRILKGATHAVEDGEARGRLCEEVVGWLRRVIG